jgi:hypothetical protein
MMMWISLTIGRRSAKAGVLFAINDDDGQIGEEIFPSMPEQLLPTV